MVFAVHLVDNLLSRIILRYYFLFIKPRDSYHIQVLTLQPKERVRLLINLPQ